MSAPRPDPIDDPSWIPPRSAFARLFAHLAAEDDELAGETIKALARAGSAAFSEAITRLAASDGRLAARLCRLLSRARSPADRPSASAALVLALASSEDRVARAAASALGRIGDEAVGPALIARLERADGSLARAIVEALGKVGDGAALAAIESASLEKQVDRTSETARLRLLRTSLRRTDAGRIDASSSSSAPLEVLLHVRGGLEELAQMEAGDDARVASRGRIAISLHGPLERLRTLRIPLRIAFPLPPPIAPLPSEGEVLERAVVEAMLSAPARRIFDAFTEGPVRYRLEWIGGGPRRAATMRVATAILALDRQIVNDPTASLWELSVDVLAASRGESYLELWPRGLPDDRFSYRHRDVAGASHPTIAAAIAFAGGGNRSDVCWDPFVGSGRELIERARLGRFSRLYGSDVSANALSVARENLAAVGVAATLIEGRAERLRLPEQPTLILTNPPMGRRVLERSVLPELLTATLENVASQLAPGGRIVWLSPLFSRTNEVAERLGLERRYRARVDMGGFDAELQVLERG